MNLPVNLPISDGGVRNAPGDRAFRFEPGSVVRTQAGRGAISDLAVSPGRLILAHYGSDAISVLDTTTCRVAATISGLAEPFAVATSGAEDARAYVSTARAACDSVDVVDVCTDRLLASHRVAHRISDLAVSPDGTRSYAARNGVRGADVAIIDTEAGECGVIELAATADVTTECVRISRDGRRLYVGTNGPAGGALHVVDLDAAGPPRIAAVVELGLPIRDVAVSADGRTAYVASCGPVVGAVVDIVDTGVDTRLDTGVGTRAAKIIRTRKIDEITGPLTRLTLSRDGGRAYAISDDRVTVLSTRTLDVVGEITEAEHPSCIAESPEGTRLYVGDFAGAVLAARIAAPAPAAIASEPHHGESSTAWLPPFGAREPALA